MNPKTRNSEKQKKPGASPGTYVYTGKHQSDAPNIKRYVYDRDSLNVHVVTNPADALVARASGMRLLVMVTGLHDEEQVSTLCHEAGLSHLLIEDILHVNSRPKIESHDEILFITIDAIEVDKSDHMHAQRVALVATRDCVLCFTETKVKSIMPVLERIKVAGSRLRSRGSDYAAWAIIDCVIDHYFEVVDHMRDRIDKMETRISTKIRDFDVRDLYSLKREIDFLRRRARPAREIVTVLQRADSPVISEETVPYLRDLYDHTVQFIDDLESLRDSVVGLRDYYSATVSNRMNEVMKVLTSISTIFLPLTFLAGIYGMNFDYMPELKWRWAYPALWAVFGISALAMLWVFRRKKWI
jgi:magnesium transporter